MIFKFETVAESLKQWFEKAMSKVTQRTITL